MRPLHLFVPILASFILVSCGEDAADDGSDEVVRGLRAFEVSKTADSEMRRYPSVIQPARESKLAFETAGQLSDFTLEVGERVVVDQVLAEIDPKSLQLQADQAQAALDQANASYRNAKSDLDRKTELLKNGYVTQAAFDQSQSATRSAQAQVDQAQKKLDITVESLSKSKLLAPFDGIVSSIEVDSFALISTGQAILGLYSDNSFEISFSVPAIVLNSLAIGDEVNVSVSDSPNHPYVGRISEIGSRAAQVSSFPVVVTVENGDNTLKAGMAAEVRLSISLEGGGEGFLIPLSCFGRLDFDEGGDMNLGRNAKVFVFDPTTSTVSGRMVYTSGIRENMAIVTEGLSVGDIIASAGVSYLRDGQEVHLLPMND